MNKIRTTTLIIILLGILIQNCIAQEKRSWQIEFLPGLAYVPPMPLKIEQEGHPSISMTAHYRTESFKLPIYYSYRLSSFKNNRGWSLEMNHLKIHLDNTTSEVQSLSVSHGYNQLFFNHHLVKPKHTWIFGIGAVIGHPESTIRNQSFDEKGGLFNDGYYISGYAIQAAIYYPLINTKHFVLPLEGKVTMGYGQIPIVDGKAHIPVIAFHLLFGPAFKW